jgi:hypothetical protein
MRDVMNLVEAGSAVNRFKVGDVVKVKIATDYDKDGNPVPTFVEGHILFLRPSNHPATRSWVAEVDIGRDKPRVAYLHDLAQWNP